MNYINEQIIKKIILKKLNSKGKTYPRTIKDVPRRKRWLRLGNIPFLFNLVDKLFASRSDIHDFIRFFLLVRVKVVGLEKLARKNKIDRSNIEFFIDGNSFEAICVKICKVNAKYLLENKKDNCQLSRRRKWVDQRIIEKEYFVQLRDGRYIGYRQPFQRESRFQSVTRNQLIFLSILQRFLTENI